MAEAVAYEPWTLPGNLQLADTLQWKPEQPSPFVPSPHLAADADPSSTGVVEEGLGRWILGAIGGEWVEEQTMGQIAVDFGLSVIPGVDQVFDVRDLAAHVYYLGWEEQYDRPMRWVGLVLSLVGLIPGAGSVIKSAGKAAMRGLQALFGQLDEILAIGRRMQLVIPDTGALVRWLRHHWARARAFGLKAWDRILSRAGEIAAAVPGYIPGLRDAVLKALTKLATLTPQWLPKAFDDVERALREALESIERRLAPTRTDAVTDPDEAFADLGKELGSKPIRVLDNWTVPGDWKKAKPEAYKLIFGSETLPNVNVDKVKMTLGHHVEKVNGGTHSLENLMPQLNAVNVKLSGIFSRKKFHLKLPSGEQVRLTKLNGKPIEGSLRESFASGTFTYEEQRAISNYMMFQVIGENPVFERDLADLIMKIPNLAALLN